MTSLLPSARGCCADESFRGRLSKPATRRMSTGMAPQGPQLRSDDSLHRASRLESVPPAGHWPGRAVAGPCGWPGIPVEPQPGRVQSAQSIRLADSLAVSQPCITPYSPAAESCRRAVSDAHVRRRQRVKLDEAMQWQTRRCYRQSNGPEPRRLPGFPAPPSDLGQMHPHGRLSILLARQIQ